MITLDQIARELDLTLVTDSHDLSEVVPTGGYVSDMLSCVMSGAPRQGIWVTLQAHVNIVAVAALLELAAIIVTENALLDPAAISRANEKGVTIFSTPKTSFEVAGVFLQLWLRSG